MRIDQLMQRFLLCLAAWLVSVPAAAQQNFVVGNWFGMDQPRIKSVMWIASWRADGSFSVHFRHCKKGKDQDLRSAGSWSFHGKILTNRTTAVDGEPFAVTDVYEVLSHEKERLSYREIPSGFVYYAARVNPDFQMPSCELTS